MSTHSVNIVEITEVRTHPNADALEIIPVGGFQCVSAKGNFRVGDRAIYVEPDYMVPVGHELFEFLRKAPEQAEHRLKAIRLRGELSYGLLVPLPECFADRAVGDDVMADLNIRRYEPPEPGSGPRQKFGDSQELAAAEHPKIYCCKFDIEDLRKHSFLFKEDEEVLVTEKLHGTNAKAVFWDDKMYVGSRTRWLKPDSVNIWTQTLLSEGDEGDPWTSVEKWCRINQGRILFGEIYGPVQELKYGLTKPKFAAFAALDRDGKWIDTGVVRGTYTICGGEVPKMLYEGPYDLGKIKELIEGDSRVPTAPKGHMMEGCVVVPKIERVDPRHGRVALKLISDRYWLKK
jgi:RNA ligase (TIGR02306 family)